MGTEANGGCDLLIPKSPWKTSAADFPVTGADSESWPALSGAQRPKNNVIIESKSTKSPPPPPPPRAQAKVDGRDRPKVAPAPVEQQKFHGRGNTKNSRRTNNTHQNKMGPKHSSTTVPPLTVPPSYHPPVVTPYFHPMVPVPSVHTPGFVHQLPQGIFPRPDARVGKSGGDHGGTKEQHVQTSSPWNNQRLVAPNNFHFLQTLGPRPYLRPHFFSPTGFVDGPKFPGPVCYLPYPPPGSARVPFPPTLAPHPLFPVVPMSPSPGVPMSPSPTMALRTRLTRQIEYYFSDQNLRFDNYLKSRMDNQGWVPISIIANFQRVKQMNADIPFILDALQASETIEVQGEKVRRRHDWSQWIQAPVSKFSSQVTNNEKCDVRDENKSDSCEGKIECPTPKRSSKGHLSADVTEKSINSDAEQVEDRILSSDEAPIVASGISISSLAVGFQPDVDDDTQLDKSIFLENCESGTMQVLPNLNVKNLDDPTLDFSSSFMLEEKLELKQTTIRVDDEDEVSENEQTVERLVIVTQNSLMSVGLGNASKTISNEIASAINDGLYFYEQELNSKRSHRRRNEPITESRVDEPITESRVDEPITDSRVDEPKYSDIDDALLNSRPPDHSAGRSNYEGPENSCPRIKQTKSSSKQRLFFENFESGRNSVGEKSESPPSDAVGFFFGSAPPDDSPVGSAPKPFPTFQHTSYKLLQENGFEQQLYKKYEKRCLREREKMGIGRSKEMKTLFRFWCYLLRDMFFPCLYNEFKKLALEDAAANNYYGLECLFRFYSYGLEKEFREDLYEDFEQLALDFYKKGNLYGLEKYWAFHQNGEIRGQAEPLKKHPELDRLLREEYRSLDDFNCAKSKSNTLQEAASN